jgi:DNA-binding NarL/FixJ family response regulator
MDGGDGLAGSETRNVFLMELQFKQRRQDELISGFAHRFRFTPRQGQVFRLWLEGLAAKDIAAELSLTNGTLRRYARNIYQKCGVRSERETLALFVRSMLGVE